MHSKKNSYLACCVPDLHGDRSVVDEDFLGKEVRANGGLVLVGEFLIHVLVHQGRFADSAVAENNHF